MRCLQIGSLCQRSVFAHDVYIMNILNFKNARQLNSFECVSIHLIIFYAKNGAVGIQLTRFSCDDYENTCILSYCHNQILSITNVPLFRDRSWNNSMRNMSFYIIMYTPSVYHRVFSHTYHNIDINALYEYMESIQLCLTFHFCVFKIWILHLILILNYKSTIQSATLVLHCLA